MLEKPWKAYDVQAKSTRPLDSIGVLSKLDVLLIMEELTEHLAQLRAFFGWDIDLQKTPWRSHPHRFPKQVFTPEELDFLRELNRFDHQLLSYGRELARERTSKAWEVLKELSSV